MDYKLELGYAYIAMGNSVENVQAMAFALEYKVCAI